jgi:hypothetical protein
MYRNDCLLPAQIDFWTNKIWWDKTAQDYNKYLMVSNSTAGGSNVTLSQLASSRGGAFDCLFFLVVFMTFIFNIQELHPTVLIVCMILQVLCFFYLLLLAVALEDKIMTKGDPLECFL